MSDKTEQERELEKSNELAQKIILGEISPDLVQSYRIIKNCVDSAILKGIFSGGDNALLVRAFDTLRNHINEVNNIDNTQKAEKTTAKVEETEVVAEKVKEETKKPAKKEKVKEETKPSKPARKKR